LITKDIVDSVELNQKQEVASYLIASGDELPKVITQLFNIEVSTYLFTRNLLVILRHFQVYF
jgi:hypothetical protein